MRTEEVHFERGPPDGGGLPYNWDDGAVFVLRTPLPLPLCYLASLLFGLTADVVFGLLRLSPIGWLEEITKEVGPGGIKVPEADHGGLVGLENVGRRRNGDRLIGAMKFEEWVCLCLEVEYFQCRSVAMLGETSIKGLEN